MALGPAIEYMSRLLLLTIFAVSSLSASAADEKKSLKTFLTLCFKGYVSLLDKRAHTDRSKAAAVERSIEQLKKRCLSEDFRKFWKQNESDSDPLLQAQDSCESWKSVARVENLDIEKNSARVILGKLSEEYCLSIDLKKVSSGYQIRSTSVCAATPLNCDKK